MLISRLLGFLSLRNAQPTTGAAVSSLVQTPDKRFYTSVDLGAPSSRDWGRTVVRSQPNEHSHPNGPSNDTVSFPCLREKPVGASEVWTRDLWTHSQALGRYVRLARQMAVKKTCACIWKFTRPADCDKRDGSLRTYAFGTDDLFRRIFHLYSIHGGSTPANFSTTPAATASSCNLLVWYLATSCATALKKVNGINSSGNDVTAMRRRNSTGMT